MDTKVLLAGIIGFLLGGLLVSIAATTFENDQLQQDPVHGMRETLKA